MTRETKETEISIPVLSRKTSSCNFRVDSPAGQAKGDDIPAQVKTVAVEIFPPKSLDTPKDKSRLDEIDLRQDISNVGLMMLISGAVVSLNVFALLLHIPGLQGGLSWSMFSLKGMQNMSQILADYTTKHRTRVLTVLPMLGTWVQTFMIPGATILNMLSGNLFGMWMGLAVAMFYNTLGSIILYMLSRSMGRLIAKRYLNERIEKFRLMFQSSDSLFINIIYLTSLRIFPFTPNWFLNVSAAMLDIPWAVFVPSLIIGLLPYNFIAVRAGLMFRDLSSSKIIDTNTAMQLGALAAVGLTLPSIISRVQKWFSKENPAVPTVEYYWMQVRKAGMSRDEEK